LLLQKIKKKIIKSSQFFFDMLTLKILIFWKFLKIEILNKINVDLIISTNNIYIYIYIYNLKTFINK